MNWPGRCRRMATWSSYATSPLWLYAGATLSALFDIGRRTGLFDAAATGPATSVELADRAALEERYVREWLGGMSTARIFDYEPETRTYRFPPEHAVILTGNGPDNLTGLALLTTILANHVAEVADAFRNGGGVPYEAFAPEIHDVLDALGTDLHPPPRPRLPAARSRPHRTSRRRSLRRRRRLRHRHRTVPVPSLRSGLGNVRFEQVDAAEQPFDVVFVSTPSTTRPSPPPCCGTRQPTRGQHRRRWRRSCTP